jgi:surface protein
MKFNNDTIRTAVQEWLENPTKAEKKYEHILSWDVSDVTNMDYLFYVKDSTRWRNLEQEKIASKKMLRRIWSFNDDISMWNVSNVTSMKGIFKEAQSFTQDISNWDVSNVIDMSEIFYNAKSFNKDIGGWDTSKLIYARYMFLHAKSFNQDISNWNMSSVVNMYGLFASAESFNQEIGNWDISNVTDMGSMFSHAESFNQDISKWNVSNVANMSEMFEGICFNKDISKNGNRWNTRNVTNMKWMFYYARDFNGDIKNWNTSNVTDMELMFYGAHAFKDKVTTFFDTWDTKKAEETAEKLINPSFSPFKSKLVFKKYFKYLLGLIVLLLITTAYLFRKRFISINKKKVAAVFKGFLLKNTWSIKPMTADLSEIEKKIAKLYSKNKVIEIIHVFEKHIFEDSIFKQQGVNIKEFSKLTGVPLRHCYYIFKTHVNYPFTKFKNYSRIEASLQLINNNYLLKGTFESLSLEVGFESYSPFYTSFKEYTSLTPSDYMISRKS